MIYIISYLVIMSVCFIVQFIFGYYMKGKYRELGTAKNYVYIVKKYKLSMDKIRVKKLTMYLIIVNSILLPIPMVIILFTNINYILMLLLSLIIYIVGLLSLYNLVGIVLKKKGW